MLTFRSTRAVLVAVALAAGAIGGTGGVAAAATTSTLTGGGSNGAPFSPDSVTAVVSEVDASVTRGMASGSLETVGRPTGGPDGTEYIFSGSVKCMRVMKKGARVIVGASGTVEVRPPNFSEWHQLAGKYEQILTVEPGEFEDPYEPGRKLHATFGLLGEDYNGVMNNEPPTCKKFSFKHQMLPTGGEDFVFTTTK